MLNDPTIDQIPPSELAEKNESAKVTENAGNFSNQFQNQQGHILDPFILQAQQKGGIQGTLTAILLKFVKFFDEFVMQPLFKLSKPVNKFLNKHPTLNAAANTVFDYGLGAYPKFAEYVCDRIIARSSRIRNYIDKKGEFGKFEPFRQQKGIRHTAKRWASEAGASIEEARELSNKLNEHSDILIDYNRFTRNEFRKQYPHLKDVAQTADDEVQADRRQSLKGIVKDIKLSRAAKVLRQYRQPNNAEASVFSKQLAEHMGLLAKKYFVPIVVKDIRTNTNTRMMSLYGGAPLNANFKRVPSQTAHTQ